MADIAKQTGTKSKRIFYGWWVVIAGSFLYLLNTGSVFYGFNAFFNPIIDEFGWSRTATSGVFSISRLEGGIAGPIVGWLIDKFSVRKVAFVGIFLAGIGYIVLSRINSVLSLYLIFGLLLSVGSNAASFHPTSAAAVNWFHKKRSLALAFITAGGGLGGAMIVPLLAWLITQYGWRSAAVIIGVILLIFGLPTAFFLRGKPEDMGLLPDGEPVVQAAQIASKGQLTGVKEQSMVTDASPKEIDFTVREALRSRAFWIYSIAMMLRACILSGLVVHEIPYLVDKGIPYEAAASILGMMVLISVPGRLLFGWMGDRFDKRWLTFVSCLLQAVGVWILINTTSLTMLYVFTFVFGLGYGGAITLTTGLRGDLFGRRKFASIGGIVTGLTAVGSVGAPVLAGYLYDTTQSYKMAFYIFLVLVLLSGFAFLLIPKPKAPAKLTVA